MSLGRHRRRQNDAVKARHEKFHGAPRRQHRQKGRRFQSHFFQPALLPRGAERGRALPLSRQNSARRSGSRQSRIRAGGQAEKPGRRLHRISPERNIGAELFQKTSARRARRADRRRDRNACGSAFRARFRALPEARRGSGGGDKHPCRI